MISNSRMQITLLSFLFKQFNIYIIKKGINIKDTLKLYAVLFSCFIYAKAVGSSNIGAIRALFLRVRKGAEGALINIHTNEGA
jgi:hypothetical protein